MLARWTAILALSFGLLVSAQGVAKATGGSKGTETGQTAASPKSDQSQGTTAETRSSAPRGDNGGKQ